jgi:hypothetical protein
MLVVCLYCKPELLNLVKEFCLYQRKENGGLLEFEFRLQYLSVSRLQQRSHLFHVIKSPNCATGLYYRQIEVYFPKEMEILCFAQGSGQIWAYSDSCEMGTEGFYAGVNCEAVQWHGMNAKCSKAWRKSTAPPYILTKYFVKDRINLALPFVVSWFFAAAAADDCVDYANNIILITKMKNVASRGIVMLFLSK